MTSLYSKTSVSVRPHVNEERAFSELCNLQSVFEKDAFSVTVFSGYMWTVDQTGKKISVFKNQKRYVGTGHQFKFCFSFGIIKCP